MSRKKMEREPRRRFVLAAARKLFATKGIENASMDDIAIAADYTRRTLYSYFKSHDEICLLVLLEDQAIRWEKQKDAIARVDGGLAKLRTWAESLYQFVKSNPQYVRLEVYWDFHGVNGKLIGDEVFARFEKQNNELADGLRDIFRLGIKDGSIRADLNIDICISHFLYSLRSVLNRAFSPGYSFATFDAGEYIKHYLDLFERGIRSNGENNQ
ncbi:MAG: TetR/AcrR family transcriptional regulator [FCB group bacterium]|nr:TetR/AcrR family transcriptional regulator [FCB group bacterium]